MEGDKMNNIIKKITIGMFLAIILAVFYIPSTTAEATVEYTIDPEQPKPQSEVNIIAKITDDDITSVYLEMQECNTAGTCFGWKTNVSMTPTGNTDEYEASITLEREDTKYFSLRLAIDKNGEWEHTSTANYYDVTLDRSTSNGDDNNSDNNTPGFETILTIIAILSGVILIKRKR
jgi:hypothetical protein